MEEDGESGEYEEKEKGENQVVELSSKKRWKFVSKHYFNRNARVTSCSFAPNMSVTPNSAAAASSTDVVLSVGFASGVFGLWILSFSSLSPPFTNIHSLRYGFIVYL